MYHGTITSLYGALPINVVSLLEDAILKTKLGLYEAAEKVFENNDLSAYHGVPVVALERSELYLSQFKCRRALAALDMVPKPLPQEKDEESDLQLLLIMSSGALKIKAEGLFRPAQEAADKIRGRWATKQVNDYNDIQVECIRKYVLACIFLFIAPSETANHFQPMPMATNTADDTPRWQGLTDLRQALQDQGRIMEALRLGTLERSLTAQPVDRLQNINMFLGYIRNRRSQVQESENQVHWHAAMLRLHLDKSKLFTSCNMKSEAEASLIAFERELEETFALVNGTNGDLSTADAMGSLSVAFCRLNLIDENERTELHFRELVKLSERMMMGTHIETEQCQYKAIAWAKQLFSDSDQVVRDIQFRTQHLFEHIQGRVPDAAANLCELLTPKMQNINETARNLDILSRFEKKYLRIENPLTRGMLDTLRSALQRQRGDHTLSTGNHPDPNLVDTSSHGHHPELQSIVLSQDLLFNYFSRPEQLSVAEFLYRLVREDTAPSLPRGALMETLALSEEPRTLDHAKFLKLTGREMLQRLVGCAASPVNNQEWLKRRPALQSWLFQNLASELPVRHCVWIGIHNARIRVWIEHCRSRMWTATKPKTKGPTGGLALSDGLIPGTNVPADLFFSNTQELISAIKERVELNEARLGYMFDHYERETRYFMASLPLLYMQLFFSSHTEIGERVDTRDSHLSLAEILAREQLEYWRASNDSIYVAMQAINIATVVQYRIECGKIKEVTTSNESVTEALRLLDEVEALFGSTLSDVDLERSLSSLQIKVHMGAKMDIWRASNIAIQILLSAINFNLERDDSSCDERRAEHQNLIMLLWQWVQRSKARALTHSMRLDKEEIQNRLLMRIQESLVKGLNVKANGVPIDDESRRLQLLASLPMRLLPEIRDYLEKSNFVVPHFPIPETANVVLIKKQLNPGDTAIADIVSFVDDLRKVGGLESNIGSYGETSHDIEVNSTETLSAINEIIKLKPDFYTILRIASLLNEESRLLKHIQCEGEFPGQVNGRKDLQTLRKEMTKEPLLQELLQIREGRPLFQEDMQEIAAARNGKAVFIDWFTNMSLFGAEEDIYMVLWRNGTFELVDLKITLSDAQYKTRQLLDKRETLLASVPVAPSKNMNNDNIIPVDPVTEKKNLKPIINGSELVKPLFEQNLIEPGDLLIFSVTEGFDDYPLHAIQPRGYQPLIVHHSIVYVPSLSVLHRCYLSRHNGAQSEHSTLLHKARFLGGLESSDSAYQHGIEGVKRLQSLVNISSEKFTGPEATVANFRQNLEEVDLWHIHLHTSYKIKARPRDIEFTSSPLSQTLCFADDGLEAQEVLTLPLAQGAHLNLAACASGQQGRFDHGNSHLAHRSNETMGLVPAFLFAGAGSVTGTLWAVMDEHAVVFAGLFWKAVGAFFANDGGATKAEEGKSVQETWIDLADILREVVLEMRRLYVFPSAWAGFALNGYWRVRV